MVQTNLLGSLLCTRAAARAMAATGGGHIFNMDGAGADGQATPQYAAYGATKAGALPSWRALLASHWDPIVACHTHNVGTFSLHRSRKS